MDSITAIVIACILAGMILIITGHGPVVLGGLFGWWLACKF